MAGSEFVAKKVRIEDSRQGSYNKVVLQKQMIVHNAKSMEELAMEGDEKG